MNNDFAGVCDDKCHTESAKKQARAHWENLNTFFSYLRISAGVYTTKRYRITEQCDPGRDNKCKVFPEETTQCGRLFILRSKDVSKSGVCRSALAAAGNEGGLLLLRSVTA
ncbi:hypothetical protein KCP71_24650 [Salmonella enterica subsp. enterica]|nr:hypothetical protein KCP71_24650 [Salmonella enterica subsp. enterica]